MMPDLNSASVPSAGSRHENRHATVGAPSPIRRTCRKPSRRSGPSGRNSCGYPGFPLRTDRTASPRHEGAAIRGKNGHDAAAAGHYARWRQEPATWGGCLTFRTLLYTLYTSGNPEFLLASDLQIVATLCFTVPCTASGLAISPESAYQNTQKKCKAENGSFHRIWMGVGRPGAFVNLGNRFPVHYQSLTTLSNDRSATTSGRLLSRSTSSPHYSSNLSLKAAWQSSSHRCHRCHHYDCYSPAGTIPSAGRYGSRLLVNSILLAECRICNARCCLTRARKLHLTGPTSDHRLEVLQCKTAIRTIGGEKAHYSRCTISTAVGFHNHHSKATKLQGRSDEPHSK